MKNVILIGDLNYNINLFFNSYPREGQMFNIVKKTKSIGNALNISIILTKYGINTYYLSNVGDDYEGSQIINYLHRNLISSEYINIVNNTKTSKNYILRNQKNNSKTTLYERNNYKYDLTRKIDFIPEIIYNNSSNYELIKELKIKFKNTKIISYVETLDEKGLQTLRYSDYIILPLKFAEILSNIKLDMTNKKSITEIYLKTKKLFSGIIIIYDEQVGTLYEYNNIINIVPKLGNKNLVKENSFDIYKSTLIYSILNNFNLDKSIKLSTFSKFLCDNNKTILNIEEVIRLYEENS